MKTTTIWKIPTTDFTHTEMAQLNNVSNQAVWAEYKRLRDEGFLVSAGIRKGSGKPTGVWKVADGHEIVTDTTMTKQQAAPCVNRVPKPIVVPITVELSPVIQSALDDLTKVVEQKYPSIKPATPPVVVVDVVPPPVVVPVTNHVVCNLVANEITETDYLCPICGHKVLAQNDATGIMVWCCQPQSVCSPHENPFGHTTTRSVKDAYETLCDKFKVSK
jgi:hypothetical protein